ncbi:transposase [Bacillus sp. REN3]|uniref:transposase n=1 Tax=Bacillus sp. REN3 TaxID=2802440 RepID=UPI001AEDA917|nr:transposase [Bacillus sp. REN3]
MPRRARQKSVNGIYHVMLRGANRQEIFHDEFDNMKFLDIVKRYKEIAEFSLYGWCLMGNHVHLLLKEGNEDLSITMKRIGVSYASYYNLKYQTTGHLFQDRFRSENVESVRYFKTVLRYIHQNPVKAGIIERVDEWRWSSCAGYYGKPYYPGGLLDQDPALRLFSENNNFAREQFREYNETPNEDECLNNRTGKRRLSDDEARQEIKKMLKGVEIAQVKSLPRHERVEVLKDLKTVEGLTQRQAARILGISASIIFRA